LTERGTRMPACAHVRVPKGGRTPEEGNEMHRALRTAGRIGSHRKAITYLSAALVLAGTGTASAAAFGAASADAAVVTGHTARVAAAPHHAGRPGAAPHTFLAVRDRLNWQTNPALAAKGITPPGDKLLPVQTSGQQSYIPISAAQYANATAIVRQALAMRMGLRSAVIAVATAMQESKLLNVDYGTGDSLGLFQQQWDMGWGSPQQIMNPAYAAGQFLGALRSYQQGNRAWASQPLYSAAQGVQRSAFPYAYAQWETQAAQLTSSIIMHQH
jgi:hypothetical protein